MTAAGKADQQEAQKGEENHEPEKKAFCGIIMPIAAMPGYESSHWARVREVLNDAISSIGYIPRMVSEGDEIAVIHGNIVQNLYADEIVVCDVSGKNPNVMFELGLRLAFDKPTIIIKDDETGYSFDTSPVKHIPYRKDQRFDDVTNFKKELVKAIKASVAAKKADDKYSPFLKNFTNITPKHIENKEVPQSDFIVSKLNSLEVLVRAMVISQNNTMKVDISDGYFSKKRAVQEAYKMRDARVASDDVEQYVQILNFLGKKNQSKTLMPIAAKLLISQEIVDNGKVLSSNFDELFTEAWSYFQSHSGNEK